MLQHAPNHGGRDASPGESRQRALGLTVFKPKKRSRLEFSPVRGEDVLLSASSDDDDNHTRQQKKARREQAASDYLHYEHLPIFTAGLRGPFESGWKNPWARPKKKKRIVIDLTADSLESETTQGHSNPGLGGPRRGADPMKSYSPTSRRLSSSYQTAGTPSRMSRHQQISQKPQTNLFNVSGKARVSLEAGSKDIQPRLAMERPRQPSLEIPDNEERIFRLPERPTSKGEGYSGRSTSDIEQEKAADEARLTELKDLVARLDITKDSNGPSLLAEMAYLATKLKSIREELRRRSPAPKAQPLGKQRTSIGNADHDLGSADSTDCEKPKKAIVQASRLEHSWNAAPDPISLLAERPATVIPLQNQRRLSFGPGLQEESVRKPPERSRVRSKGRPKSQFERLSWSHPYATSRARKSQSSASESRNPGKHKHSLGSTTYRAVKELEAGDFPEFEYRTAGKIKYPHMIRRAEGMARRGDETSASSLGQGQPTTSKSSVPKANVQIPSVSSPFPVVANPMHRVPSIGSESIDTAGSALDSLDESSDESWSRLIRDSLRADTPSKGSEGSLGDMSPISLNLLQHLGSDNDEAAEDNDQSTYHSKSEQEAQKVSRRVPSNPSTEQLQLEDVPLRFASTEENTSYEGVSTQAKLDRTRRPLHSDLKTGAPKANAGNPNWIGDTSKVPGTQELMAGIAPHDPPEGSKSGIFDVVRKPVEAVFGYMFGSQRRDRDRHTSLSNTSQDASTDYFHSVAESDGNDGNTKNGPDPGRLLSNKIPRVPSRTSQPERQSPTAAPVPGEPSLERSTSAREGESREHYSPQEKNSLYGSRKKQKDFGYRPPTLSGKTSSRSTETTFQDAQKNRWDDMDTQMLRDAADEAGSMLDAWNMDMELEQVREEPKLRGTGSLAAREAPRKN